MTRAVASLPFHERLAVAREMMAKPMRMPPTWIGDQLAAAAAETRIVHERVGAVLPILEPDRSWRRRDADPTAESTAYLLAALLGCLARLCCHLRRGGGPQPAVAHLPLRRVDCLRCAGTFRRPPRQDADRCDVCGRHGVATFVPIVASRGPVTIGGDACTDCAMVLLGEVAA
jgi:hypothetical protein